MTTQHTKLGRLALLALLSVSSITSYASTKGLNINEQFALRHVCANPEKTLETIEKYKSTVGEALSAQTSGDVYQQCYQNNTKAEEWYAKAYQLGNKGAAVSLGKMSLDKKDYPNAIKWYSIGFDAGRSIGGSGVANVYELQEDYKQAAIWYQKVVDANRLDGQNQIVGTYQSANQLANIQYEQFNDYESAELNYKKAIDIIMSAIQFKTGVPSDNLFELYLKTNHPKKAEEFLMWVGGEGVEAEWFTTVITAYQTHNQPIHALGMAYAALSYGALSLDDLGAITTLAQGLTESEKAQAIAWQQRLFKNPYTGKTEIAFPRKHGLDLALFYIQNQQWEGAKAVIKSQAELNPDKAWYFELIEAYRQAQRPAEALAMYSAMLSYDKVTLKELQEITLKEGFNPAGSVYEGMRWYMGVFKVVYSGPSNPEITFPAFSD